jgi:hypothetical protein
MSFCLGKGEGEGMTSATFGPGLQLLLLGTANGSVIGLILGGRKEPADGKQLVS